MADTNIDIKQSKGGRAKGVTRGRKRRCSKGEKQGAVGGVDAEESHAEEGHAKEGHAKEGHAEESHAEESHAEEGHAEEGHAEEGLWTTKKEREYGWSMRGAIKKKKRPTVEVDLSLNEASASEFQIIQQL